MNWHPIHADLSAELGASLYQALSETGSMTAYLRSKTADFSVYLLHQDLQRITDPQMAHYMDITDAKPALVRQVILSCDQHPCILGHCIIPHDLYQQHQRGLTQLGQHPIGEYLFASSQLQRSPIFYTQLPVDSDYHRLLSAHSLTIETPLWARRSQLYDETIRVGIIEVILPALLAMP